MVRVRLGPVLVSLNFLYPSIRVRTAPPVSVRVRVRVSVSFSVTCAYSYGGVYS